MARLLDSRARSPLVGVAMPLRPDAAAASAAAVAVVALLGAAVQSGARRVAASEPPPSPCAASVARTAAPASVALGEAVTVTTHLALTCPEPLGIDVVLVIDRSPSMRGQPLADAKAAAEAFVAAVVPAGGRVGVVTFSSTAEIAARLARDARYLGAAVRAIEVPDRGGTDIHDGLWLAGRLATADGDGRPQAILLLSDGRNGVGPLPVVQQAAVQREAGRQLVTVALGIQADVALMRAIATSPEDALVAPHSDALVDRLLRAADRLTDVQARDLAIAEHPPDAAPYVAGSSRPPAAWDGAVVRWSLPLVPAQGVTVTHRVRPVAAGHQRASLGGQATFVDSSGAFGAIALPPAWVTVWDGAPTGEPSREPTATQRPPSASPTPTPSPTADASPPSGAGASLYLPAALAHAAPGAGDPLASRR